MKFEKIGVDFIGVVEIKWVKNCNRLRKGREKIEMEIVCMENVFKVIVVKGSEYGIKGKCFFLFILYNLGNIIICL